MLANQMEKDTWARITESDREAFLSVYNINYQALFCYGFSISTNKELTKDCIHDMFLEIWEGRESLNKAVITIRSYLFTWLRRKMSRELSRLAKEKSNQDHSGDFEFIQASYEDILIAFQQTEESKQKLRAALKKLTKKQLEIIRLKFFESLTYRDIAIRLSLTPRTVYNSIYESIRSLRESIKMVLLSLLI